MSETQRQVNTVPPITEASVKEVADAIFSILKQTAEKHNLRSYPHRTHIMTAIIKGIYDIGEYIEIHPIDVVTKRDTIKLIAFSAPHLIKEINNMPEFDFPPEYVYRACFSLLATVYSNKNFSTFPNLIETCQILSSLALDNNNKVAAYAYLKGIHEGCEYL